jgi:hypothetical protein
MNLDTPYRHYVRRCAKRRVQPVDLADWPFMKRQSIRRLTTNCAD